MSYSYDRRTKIARGARLDPKLRRQVNDALDRAGFGGKRKFRRMGEALNAVMSVLSDHGIEQDETLNAHHFNQPKGTANIDIAFSNAEDPFSPENIGNSWLHMSWEELRADTIEVIAYLS
jgi:hypothetical protein